MRDQGRWPFSATYLDHTTSN